MNQNQFDKLAVELFGAVLEPAGFAHSGNGSTFFRQVSADIYNIVIPDMGSRGVWYDVKVAPVSPLVDPIFHSKFPDNIGIFTNAFLNKYEGVGFRQQQFNCKSEENFRRIFAKEVAPLLVQKAIPFLDKIQSLRDLLPIINNDLMKGLALHELGRKKEARPLLEAQLNRFKDGSDPDLVMTVRRLNEVLGNT